MVKAQEAMSARARARKAKAELDAKRAERDRKIVDAATEFYEGAEAWDAAQAAVAAAERQRIEAVAKLVELGQTTDEIAALCGLGAKEVRELRKAAGSKPSPSDETVGSLGEAESPETGESTAAA